MPKFVVFIDRPYDAGEPDGARESCLTLRLPVWGLVHSPSCYFDHGSAGLLSGNRSGIEPMVSLSYAVFAPIRRGHNDGPGEYWLDRATSVKDRMYVLPATYLS
jgi:hypothetical protein